MEAFNRTYSGPCYHRATTTPLCTYLRKMTIFIQRLKAAKTEP